MKTHEFLLADGHYGTSGTRQAYHTMEKFIPPSQSEIALTNRDHPCSDAHKLLLPVSHFGTFEENSTSTEPLILTITKSSDPNTTIELNFNEFLQYYCPQHAREELKDGQILNISEVTDIPSDKDEIIAKRHTLEMDMPVIEPVTFLKDLGKDVILAVISKNILDSSSEQIQNEENFRKVEHSKDSTSEEKLKIIDRDDGMTSESEEKAFKS
ncbi:hypothetical protein CEXT_585731 [Caerostris extrusa]|uniref:Uncharacterized protein n=1 Tax=Caerostris extrusa TaxID=172846 RepID=A0AAV4WHG3_CAEEX|nr:hypothetical protein CEXT_585731 [Caerostris extrusa]